ncbi:hypothetical protein [Streptomyces sp. GC420]|uniref:hypothetical protein n=1 Tax=Streptomyces sp. GC420 TaxID=2697568 RepID=UPI001414FB05|nr:hypothetical protein [Streptomyces sp. GC420]NBM17808.1 hypothetical protein [Streptomyces sp. GC420]
MRAGSSYAGRERGHGAARGDQGLPPGTPGSAAHGLALDALGSGFTTAFLVCGVAALAAAAPTAFGLIGTHRPAEDEVPAPATPGREGAPESALTA